MGAAITVVSVDFASRDYRDFGMAVLDDGPSGASGPSQTLGTRSSNVA
jgi:hypothetical protein